MTAANVTLRADTDSAGSGHGLAPLSRNAGSARICNRGNGVHAVPDQRDKRRVRRWPHRCRSGWGIAACRFCRGFVGLGKLATAHPIGAGWGAVARRSSERRLRLVAATAAAPQLAICQWSVAWDHHLVCVGKRIRRPTEDESGGRCRSGDRRTFYAARSTRYRTMGDARTVRHACCPSDTAVVIEQYGPRW